MNKLCCHLPQAKKKFLYCGVQQAFHVRVHDVVVCQSAVQMRVSDLLFNSVLTFEFGMSCVFPLCFFSVCQYVMIYAPVWFSLMFWCLAYPCPLSCAAIYNVCA